MGSNQFERELRKISLYTNKLLTVFEHALNDLEKDVSCDTQKESTKLVGSLYKIVKLLNEIQKLQKNISQNPHEDVVNSEILYSYLSRYIKNLPLEDKQNLLHILKNDVESQTVANTIHTDGIAY